MALNMAAAIKVSAEVQGSQSLNSLARQLQQLSSSSQLSKRSLDALYTETRKLGSAAGNTISSLRSQSQALRALRDEAEFGSRKFRLLTKDIEAVEARLKRYQATASQTGGLSKGNALLAGFAGGVAGYASGMIVGKATEAIGGIAQAGLNAETAQVRLRALTQQFGEYNQAQVATERIARTLRISQTEASDGFAQLYAALRPTGVTLKETEDAFVGFTAAARVSGATSAEASAALMQLKQALGSGVLQGDELRSIREQAPLVGQAIAKEMGVTVGELKQLGSEGKITTDIVLRALATLKDTELGKLNQQFDTGAQAIKDFQVAAENLGKTLAGIFGPKTIALIRDVTRGLQDMTDVLGNLAGDKDAEERLKNKIRARDMAADEAGKRFGLFDFGGKEAYFQQRQQQILDRLEEERLVKKEQQAAKEAATREQQRNKDQAAGERQAARDRSASEARKDEVKIRQQAEDKLGDAVRQRDQQLSDFRKETIKRAAELERQLGDQRLQIEREIEANRRKAAQNLEDIAGERALREARAAGLSTDALETAREVNDLFRQFDEQRIQNQNTAADRQLALQRQLEEFKVGIAEGIGRIQESYARSVSSILQDAGDKLAKKMEQGAQNAASALGGALGPNGATPGSVPGGSVGVQSLVSLARQAGFRGQDAAIMAAIAMAESGGRSGARNNNPRTGDDSYGLWQINMLGGMGPQRRRAFGIANNAALFDPAINANAARQVFESQGFGAWSVYRSGAYRAYLPAAQQAARNGSARQLIGMGGGTDAQLQAARQKLDATVNTAKTSANDSAFSSLMLGLEQKLTGITGELEQQRRSAREKLEDERLYQLLLSQGVTPELAKQRVDLERIATRERERLQAADKEIQKQIDSGKYTAAQVAQLKEIQQSYRDRIAAQGESIAKTEEEIAAAERLKKARAQSEGRDVGKGLQDGVKSYLESIGTLAEGISGVTSNALKGLEDQLVNFVTTGKASFKELAASILADMSRIIIQQMVLKPLLQGIGGLFGFKFADGGIMTANGPVPLRKYAGGGVANSPQLALFGEGSMPEAYVPLPDGRRIPVAMQGGGGGGGTTINVSVDAKGTSVQGDGGKGEQLARVVAQAVQAELIKQKRPGGLIPA